MTSTFRTILAELSDPIGDVGDDTTRHEHSPFHLATLAGTYSPDSVDSPGAAFLARIARDVAEAVGITADDTDDYRANVADLTDGDSGHEIADSAVPIYTHERWQTFVDLGAYNEDPTEIGDGDASDLTGLAGVTLYLIAGRLVAALAEELREALDEDEDEDDEEQDTRPGADLGSTVAATVAAVNVPTAADYAAAARILDADHLRRPTPRD